MLTSPSVPVPHHLSASPLSDVDVPSPDEKSVITYVSSIYDAFPKVPEGGEGISAIVSITAGWEAGTAISEVVGCCGKGLEVPRPP